LARTVHFVALLLGAARDRRAASLLGHGLLLWGGARMPEVDLAAGDAPDAPPGTRVPLSPVPMIQTGRAERNCKFAEPDESAATETIRPSDAA
jgi:hypothetical protein